MDKRYCLITNDVETTSILNHKLRDKTGEYILRQGMPRLLDLYAKHNIKATFFFTGYIAKLYPEVVKMVQPYGHEIGSHGLTHNVDQAFDVLPLDLQIDHLRQSKAILEDISGEEVISFRAPAARVNYNTPIALEETGFKIDSSVCSQRLDMFFSFGVRKKLNWIIAPRKPYFTAKDNIFKKGNSSILEIPISAFVLPYIGTFMRISPDLNKMIRNLLFLETKINQRPFVFLTHPNEYINEELNNVKIEKRASNLISYYLGDILRHKLKVKNLGSDGLPLLNEELNFFSENNFNMITCKDYYNDFRKKNKEI